MLCNVFSIFLKKKKKKKGKTNWDNDTDNSGQIQFSTSL